MGEQLARFSTIGGAERARTRARFSVLDSVNSYSETIRTMGSCSRGHRTRFGNGLGPVVDQDEVRDSGERMGCCGPRGDLAYCRRGWLFCSEHPEIPPGGE